MLYLLSHVVYGYVLLLIFQVEHFERWVAEARIKIMRPNTMNKYGAVLDDIGMENMLNQLMCKFISPMASCEWGNDVTGIILEILQHFAVTDSKCVGFPVLFMEVGGSSLDTHHGFVVEYRMDGDLELGQFYCEVVYLRMITNILSKHLFSLLNLYI